MFTSQQDIDSAREFVNDINRRAEEIGRALDKGWRFRRTLAEDPRFAPLREREDFTREAARDPR